jgi:hypothetical protein
VTSAATSPPATAPSESKTKPQAPPASSAPKGGEAGLGGNSTRDPQPESTPPSEPPPATPPPAGEEPTPEPPPKPIPGGPGELTTPPGPPKPG